MAQQIAGAQLKHTTYKLNFITSLTDLNKRESRPFRLFFLLLEMNGGGGGGGGDEEKVLYTPK